ncbi:MAG: hypothetical protein JWL90_3717 [Chthoniobacteraceae bacterium]|nr:hypothetical protein [Chthoniobacteraceae bacterium]
MKRFLPALFLILLLSTSNAQRLSALAPVPDWTALEAFQETITRDEFVHLLEEVYAPRQAARGLIDIEPERALIRTTLEPAQTWVLRFAKDRASLRPAPRFWRTAAELTAARAPAETRPLAGWRIALDPGHIGGEWARMEERWFKIGDTVPVTEGDMTLRVAELIAPQLSDLGAEILWVRQSAAPVTPERPETLKEAARAELALLGITPKRETYDGPDDPERGSTLQFESEVLFYRASEIRHRATLLNERLRPDLTLCLHFNAEEWGDPHTPALVPHNHFHVLVNGCYSAGELRNDDVRFEMLNKLLGRCYNEELAASENVAATMASLTGLPPYEYPGKNALRTGESAYIWARNLLANRLYHSPVVFLEPYVMNSQEVWERVQAGDFPGEQMVAGAVRKSLVREYADAVVAGIRSWAGAQKKESPIQATVPK